MRGRFPIIILALTCFKLSAPAIAEPVKLKAVAIVLPHPEERPIVCGAQIRSARLRIRTELEVANALYLMGQIYTDLGLDAYAKNKFDEAEKECRKVLTETRRLDSRATESSKILLWKIFFTQDDFRAAAMVCLELTYAFPNSAPLDRIIDQTGQLVERLNENDFAILFYKAILALNGGHSSSSGLNNAPDIQLAVAGCHESKGDTKKAADAYRTCVIFFPRSNTAAIAAERLGDIEYASMNYASALSHYDSVAEDYPDAAGLDRLLYRSAKCLIRMKEYQAAMERCEQIVERYPAGKYAAKVARRVRYKPVSISR